MIPLIALMELGGKHHSIRLWLPLFLVWLLMLPLAVLMLPFALLAMLLARIQPWTALRAFSDVLSGLCGMQLEIQIPGRSVLVHIY